MGADGMVFWHEVFGWVAAALTLTAFSCRHIARLRCAALLANVAFIAYGFSSQLWPVFALHAMLVPVNAYRLWQALRIDAPVLTQAVPIASSWAETSPQIPRANESAIDRALLWISGLAMGLAMLVGWAVVVMLNSTPDAPSKVSPETRAMIVVPRDQIPMARVSGPPAEAMQPTRTAPQEDDRLRRFALNAFVIPIMDDTAEGRWSDMALDHICGPNTRVWVDGQPMVVGASVPEGRFALTWDMRECAPLGSDLLLSGIVDLVVTRDRTGLSATVIPDRLRIQTAAGVSLMVGAFQAGMGIEKALGEP